MSFTKIYLTSFDNDVTFPNGPIWLSRTVRVDQKASRVKAHWKRGLDTDNCVLVLIPRPVDPDTGAAYPDKIGSTPWLAAAQAGALDGCDVTIFRAYFPKPPPTYSLSPSTPTGILIAFTGRVAECDVTDTFVALTLNDYRELLTQNFPRNLFQAGCHFTLFGFGCGLVQANYETDATIQAGSTATNIISSPISPPAQSSGTFLLGQFVMTSGLNTGFTRTVRTWDSNSNTLGLLNPLPFSVQAGDTFAVYPGCNKTEGACTAFGNRINFGGEDHIPDAGTSV